MYPNIDVDDLEMVFLQLHEKGADYIFSEDCPYPARVTDLMLEHVGGRGESDEDFEELDLVVESTRILKELKETKETLGKSDHSEAMAYFRTSTALIEKLINAKERANNVRQIGKFYGIVLDTMEEFLEPAQITDLRERLKEFGV